MPSQKIFQGLSISFFLIYIVAVAACGKILLSPAEHAMKIAVSHGWKPVYFKSGNFDLTGFIKTADTADNTLVVYIEGDGFAWKNRYTVSDNPTPKEPTALLLAVQDPSPNILYIGRPCQYIKNNASGCHPRYWTTYRYSDEVVEALNSSIYEAKQKIQAKSVGLVGFSGGGVIAALIAARRTDVAWLATVAANLDHAAWTALHKITPLNGSLNPADFAAHLQSIPQIHFVGGNDDIVPESVVRTYRERMIDPSLTKIIILPEYTHHCCWVENWQWLQKQISQKTN